MAEAAPARGRRYTIGELAALCGLRPSALRHYETVGLLQPAGRAGGRRWYDATALAQLVLIDVWQRAGFTLEEIAARPTPERGEAGAWKGAVRARLEALGAQIAAAEDARALLAHMLECPAKFIDRCPHYRAELTARAERLARGEYVLAAAATDRRRLGGRPVL